MKNDLEKFEKLKFRTEQAFDEWENAVEKRYILEGKINKINNTIRSADFIADELHREFICKTGLDGREMEFVFLGTALQCIRHFLLTQFVERVDHKAAEQNAQKQKNYLSSIEVGNQNQISRYYYASKRDIICKPGVPYDVIADKTAIPAKLSGLNHRNKTWGHDPVWGYIFGTANILTNTITYSEASGNSLINFGTMKTKHVGTTPNKVGKHMMAMLQMADTGEMFKHTLQRFQDEPSAVGIALVKQYAHIKSDEYSKRGLPLPGTNLFPNLSQTMSELGLDYANTCTGSRQIVLSSFTNYIISVLYLLYSKKYGEQSPPNIKKVKLNRIITLSNILEQLIVSTYVVATGDCHKLDIGGSVVLIQKITTSVKFQTEVEKQFVEKRLYDMLEV